MVDRPKLGKVRLFPSSWVLHRTPSTVLCTASDALLDKVHALDTVVYIWIKSIDAFNRLILRDVDHCVKRSDIDIGERFEERFRVAARKTACSLAARVHERCIWIASVEFMRLTVLSNNHDVWLFLTPRKRAFGPVDFDG